MKIYHRIRYRLMMGFLLVALIPALMIGYYSIRVSSDSLLKQETTAQQQVVAGKHLNVASFLSSAEGDVQFLADSNPLRNFVAAQQNSASEEELLLARTQLEEEFLAFSRSRKIYYQIRYLDETGQEIVRVDANDQGEVHPVAKEKLQNKANRYYFADAFKLPVGELFVSPLDLNREHGEVEIPHKPVIRYAVTVGYPDGKKAGVVLTNIDANEFLENLGDVMLVDADGYFLSHSDPALPWGSERDLGHKRNFKDDYANISSRLTSEERGSVSTDTQAASFQRIQVPGANTAWNLVSIKPLKDLLAPVKSFQQTFFGILAIGLIIALLVAFVLDSKITGPIEELTRRAEQVSMGDLSGEVKIEDKGEIGQLASAFERMRFSMVRMMARMKKT